MKEITMKCRAFSGQGVKIHRMAVYADGSVLVWDSVAGHYTMCHDLSKLMVRRAVSLAGK